MSPGLAACTDGGGGASSSSSGASSSSSSASASSSSASPTPTETPTPGATAAVEGIAWATPDSVDPLPFECGVADVQELRYGRLRIAVQQDVLMSWQLGQNPPPPTDATFPGDVVPGQPFSAATGRPGAGQPELLDNYGVYQVQVDEPGVAAPLFYWAEANDPASPVMLVAGRYLLGCG